MSGRTSLAALTLSALLAACGGSGNHPARHAPVPAAGTARAAVSHRATVPAWRAVSHRATAPASRAAVSHPATAPAAQALVTAETENRLLVVDLPSGRLVRRITLPRDPEDVAANRGACSSVVVTSAAAGKVTVLDRETLAPRRVIGGFGSPHIAEIAPGGNYAYVTDDARGTVTVIYLADGHVAGTIEVGAGAHHLAFSPDQRHVWLALSESARTIVTLDSSDPVHPRITGRFDPGFAAHDLSFSPDGRRVWITGANVPETSVLSAFDHRLLFRVAVGPGPQHVAFAGRYAYLTSGYGGTIEQVDAATGRVLARAASPYGSFELAAGDGYVVTSSLERGTLAIYTPRLKLLRVVHLAPATREVAISPPA
jgi:DNA-binding beta-propeller fold protein YncE